MFLGSKSLKKALRDGTIIVENSFDGALKGLTIDVRLGGSILIPELTGPLDPLGSNEQIKWRTVNLPEAIPENLGRGFVLNQGLLALGYTHEQISIDAQTMAIINSRSTAARLGIVTHHTAPLINPGHGMSVDGAKPRSITLELFTSLPHGVMLYSGLIIAQLKFAKVTNRLELYDERPGATYRTDHGVMIPDFSTLVPEPNLRQGLLRELIATH